MRPKNWHDLFNAITWMIFPKAKAVLNKQLYLALINQMGNKRTSRGDALTQFDEDGVIVFCSNRDLLDSLQNQRWKKLFITDRRNVISNMKFFIFGHALFEKMLTPRFGITGRAFLLPQMYIIERGHLEINSVDSSLASACQDSELLRSSASLNPLPVLGIPGWFHGNTAEGFYDNREYFRPKKGI